MPARELTDDGLALTVSITLPLPVPLAGLTVSQDWLLLAVHAASLYVAVSATSCVPPAAGALHVVGLMLNVFVPPACVTLTVRPPIVTVAPLQDSARLSGLPIEAVGATDRLDLFLFGNDDSGQARLIAALDNLGKGAAGAAVQNLNILAGLPETAGLRL